MPRSSFQSGSVIRVPRKSGDCWKLRYRLNGKQYSDLIGTVVRYPTLASAEKAADKMRGLLNNGPTEIITVEDLVDRFEAEAMPERESTASSYRSIFNRIKASWGGVRLDKFSTDMVLVEAWLKDLRVIGRHPKPGPKALVSDLYRAQVKNLLHLLMEHAMKWQAIQAQRNPIELVRLKGSDRAKEIVTLTADQYEAFMADGELPEMVKVLMLVIAGLGLRVSEALGLRWKDFDFEAKTVSIQRSMVNGVSNDTKTAGSTAMLPLHDHLIEVVRRWQVECGLKSQWMFCSERTGLPYTRDYLREEFLKPAGERIGVPGIGFHSIRHTYRAMLRDTGADAESQKNLMRHARLSTTMDTYGGRDSAERLRPMNDKVVEMLPRRSA